VEFTTSTACSDSFERRNEVMVHLEQLRVEALLGQEKWTEALAMARSFYNTSSLAAT
jgi:hypothetical protein